MQTTYKPELSMSIQYVNLYHVSKKNVLRGDGEKGHNPLLTIYSSKKNLKFRFADLINEAPRIQKNNSFLDVHLLINEAKIIKDSLAQVKSNIEDSGENIIFDDTPRVVADPSVFEPSKPLPKRVSINNINVEQISCSSDDYTNTFMPSPNSILNMFMEWEGYLGRDPRIHFGVRLNRVQEVESSSLPRPKQNLICLYINNTELGQLLGGFIYGLKLNEKFSPSTT